MMRGMVIDMNDEQLHTLAQLQAFLDGTIEVDFAVAADERYEFIARTVRRFGHGRLRRADKALVLRFLERVSGCSRQQISRLVKRGSERRPLIKRYRGSRTSFARTYTSADVLLLAHTDTLHGTLSLQGFPFAILGFHSDNGSEYINRHVAELLNKLLIEEQTKSRSRHSNDNAQAESKNGAIVRKHFDYSHIPQRFASLVNTFCREHLNPYINFHRPCLFAETITDARGRQRKRYPYKLMMTPYEKLKSLREAEQYLKPGITFQDLDARATALSDNDAAQRMNDARAILFKTIFNRSKKAA